MVNIARDELEGECVGMHHPQGDHAQQNETFLELAVAEDFLGVEALACLDVDERETARRQWTVWLHAGEIFRWSLEEAKEGEKRSYRFVAVVCFSCLIFFFFSLSRAVIVIAMMMISILVNGKSGIGGTGK